MRKSHRRFGVVLAAVVAAFALAAPAYAHFCMKTDWSDAAAEHAAKSQAWLTKSDWLAFIEEALDAGIACEEGADILRAQIAAAPDNTLFMGPGLLAGGTLFNGKGNTPDHFAYLNFAAAEEACAA